MMALAAFPALSCASSTAPDVLSPTASVAAAHVITRARFGTEVEVRVGELIRVPRPMDATRWQVDYAIEMLRPIGGPKAMAEPGPDGWRFEVVGAGTCELMLTAELTPEPARPISPSVPRFTVTIRATKP